MSYEYANQQLSVNEKAERDSNVAVERMAQRQVKRRSMRPRLDLYTSNLYRQSAEKAEKTHDRYSTSGDDCIEGARDSAVDKKLFLIAKMRSTTLLATMVHGSRRRSDMNNLEEPRRGGNESSYEHDSEHQRALTCSCNAFSYYQKLSMKNSATNFCVVCGNIYRTRDFLVLPINVFMSCSEKESALKMNFV